MEVSLSPQGADVTVAESDGGGYYTWSASTSPVLGQAKLGAGKILLHPRGFAFPHYADCDKIGLVVRGSCLVGIVLPNSTTENVLTIKKGDALPVQLGAVSWWYNAGNTDVEIVFLGETSKTYTPAQFDYFFLSGTMGILQGFSTDFISRAFDLSKNDSEKLVKSQTGAVIVKLAEGQKMPEPSSEAYNTMTYNLETAKAASVHNGSIPIADSESVQSFKEVGLTAALVRLEANSTLGPIATVDSSYQLFYVLKGSGSVQVSGIGGKNVLESKLQTGDLFVVPRFLVAAIMADGEGLQCFSVLTSSQPSFVELAGYKSMWKALSPSVLQAAFNVDLDFVNLFKSKI